MLKRLSLILLLFTLAPMAYAQPSGKVEQLANLLRLQPMFDVMREEGLTYGADLDREMLGGAGGIGWQRAIGKIYQPERIWQTFLPVFTAELENADVDSMIAFFKTDLGARIVALELEARRALLDKTIEAASKEQFHAMAETGSPRMKLLEELVQANDLVEFNVMSALNASYAFYSGMIAGQAFETPPSDAEVLKEVWAQEEEIRLDTNEWLYSYMVLAYQPLTDDELRRYVDFSKSKAGRALNAALFAAYDAVTVNVSRALGLTVAHFMQGQEL